MSGFGVMCFLFKVDDCDDVCKMMDVYGCFVCDCL